MRVLCPKYGVALVLFLAGHLFIGQELIEYSILNKLMRFRRNLLISNVISVF